MKKCLITIFVAFIIHSGSLALPLQIQARTDKQEYELGEIITIHFEITNKGDDPIIMLGGDCFYYHFYDVSSSEFLKPKSPPYADRYSGGYPLILLMSNEGFENILELKVDQADDNKLLVSTGLCSYWMPHPHISVRGFYSMSPELNKQVYKMWQLPLYDGEDIEVFVRFRVLNNKVIVEEVPKTQEQLQKEIDQRKLRYYNSAKSVGTIKATYSLDTFYSGEEITDQATLDLLYDGTIGPVTNN